MNQTRFRLDLAYDGQGFHGWASQPGLRTVQGVIQEAAASALQLLGQSDELELIAAGRTDAGVHARHQVAHLDAAVTPENAASLRHHIARLMPDDIALHDCAVAPPGFDARFSAIGRTYCYRLWDDDSAPFPAIRQIVTVLPGRLDTAAMSASATSLLGLRDFAAFCRPKPGGTTVRHLRRFDVSRTGDGMIECWLEADAFCHSMVRSLVGAVTAVGQGRRDLEWLAGVAEMTARANDVPVLPPGGLTLEDVAYPPDDLLAARAAEARQTRHPADGSC